MKISSQKRKQKLKQNEESKLKIEFENNISIDSSTPHHIPVPVSPSRSSISFVIFIIILHFPSSFPTPHSSLLIHHSSFLTPPSTSQSAPPTPAKSPQDHKLAAASPRYPDQLSNSRSRSLHCRPWIRRNQSRMITARHRLARFRLNCRLARCRCRRLERR